MDTPNFLIARFEGDTQSELIIEGFGPETIIGAVKDFMRSPIDADGRKLESITISRNKPTLGYRS